MRRPSFQFYPADWRSNAKLRRCSQAERGIWIELLCLLHDSEEYGVLRWPLKDIATAVGCRVQELRAMQEKGVLKGADHGEQVEPCIFVPRHAGRDGEPVTLLKAQAGPIWYSSRMVRDEYVRARRGAGTRFGEEPKGAPMPTPKPPIGYGPSSSSSSSSSKPLNPLSGGSAPDDAQAGKEKDGKADKRAAKAAAERAIAYLNVKAGTKFQPVEANLKRPMARMLYDGASEQDLLAVVDLKAAEAVRGEFDRKYLRPATLWEAEKFAQYVGQLATGAPAATRESAKAVAFFEYTDGQRCEMADYPVAEALQVARLCAKQYAGMLSRGNVKNVMVKIGSEQRRFTVQELSQ